MRGEAGFWLGVAWLCFAALETTSRDGREREREKARKREPRRPTMTNRKERFQAEFRTVDFD